MRGFETGRRLEGCPDGYKAENEDRIEIIEAGDALVFVVADGVGGRAHGGEAAQRAVEIVQKAVRGERANDDAEIWAERVAGIDRLLLRARETGETTLAIVAVTPGNLCRIVGASAGDSEAWLIGPEYNDVLTAQQARKPFVGSGAAAPVSFTREWNRAWASATLLVASGGLFKYADAARIREAAQHPDIEQAAQNLLNLARLPNGKLQDDVGLLLCRREITNSDNPAKPGVLKSVGKLLNWGRRDK